MLLFFVLSSHAQLSATLWTAAGQAYMALTISQSLLKLMSIESVMPSSHLILGYPLLLLPSLFPSIRVFSNESGLPIRWPCTGASTSASVLPMNIQDWFPLGLTASVSLLYKGLSSVFSNTTVQKHQFFGAQTSLWSNSQKPYMIIGKVIALTIAFTICRPFSAKWCLCFLIHCLGLS